MMRSLPSDSAMIHTALSVICERTFDSSFFFEICMDRSSPRRVRKVLDASKTTKCLDIRLADLEAALLIVAAFNRIV